MSLLLGGRGAIDRELVLAHAYHLRHASSSTPRASSFESLPAVVLARQLRRSAHDALVQSFGHSGGMDAVLSNLFGGAHHLSSTDTPDIRVRVAAYALAAARGSSSGDSEYPGATVLHAVARDGYAPAPHLLYALHCLHFSGLLPLIIDLRDADGMTAVPSLCFPNPGAEDHVLALLQHGANFMEQRVSHQRTVSWGAAGDYEYEGDDSSTSRHANDKGLETIRAAQA